MKYGDILFFKSTSWKGKFIAFCDGSPFSHVGMYWGEKDGVPLFVDANVDGVRIRPLKREWYNFIAIDPKKPIDHELGQLVLDHYGAHYDWKHLLQLGFEKLTFGLYKLPKTDAKKFICSELVNHVYGFMPEERATPRTLWEYLKNNQ